MQEAAAVEILQEAVRQPAAEAVEALKSAAEAINPLSAASMLTRRRA